MQFICANISRIIKYIIYLRICKLLILISSISIFEFLFNNALFYDLHVNQRCIFLLVIQNCIMSKIEHIRILKKFISIDIKMLLLTELLIDLTTADASDVLLHIEYSADINHIIQ